MSCAICGGFYLCAFSGQCVLPIFSACPWCSDVLVVLISRGVRHSAQANLLRMKLLPFLCQPGAYGEDDGREVVRWTNRSRLYLDSQLSEGTGVLRD